MEIILDVTPESYEALRDRMVEEAFASIKDDIKKPVEIIERALFRLADSAEVEKLGETQEWLNKAMDAIRDIKIHLLLTHSNDGIKEAGRCDQ